MINSSYVFVVKGFTVDRCIYINKYIEKYILKDPENKRRGWKEVYSRGKKYTVGEREENKMKGGFKLEIRLIKRGEGDELKNEKSLVPPAHTPAHQEQNTLYINELFIFNCQL